MEIPTVQNPKVPLPDKVRAAKATPKPNRDKPDDWWSIDLDGSLEKVLSAIDDLKISDYWKPAIKADISARCGTDFNFVSVDGHYCTHIGKGVLHYDVTARKVLI